MCSNETQLVTVPSTVGTWQSSSPVIATVGSTTGVVTTATSSGNVTISYVVNPACRATKIITVYLTPVPFGGSAGPICQGGTTLLTNTISGCTWSSSNTAVATVGSVAPSAGNGQVVGISPGTAIISYTKTTTGCARTIIVTVNPPNAGTITSPVGFALNLATLPSTALSSTGDAGGVWTLSNPTVASITAGGVITATAAGNTTVSYTVTQGSCTVTATQLVTITTSRPGGNPINNNGVPTQVLIYPNPTTGTFAINTEDAGTLHVFTLEGKEVTNYLVPAGETMITLPQDLAVGVYMCRFNGNNGSAVMIRLVYER